MGLILLEALLAGFIFVAIVWWTMFSGRKKGELPQDPQPADRTLAERSAKPPAPPPKSSAAAQSSND